MKIPQIIKRYCPKCLKHTEHKINIIKPGKRGSLKEGQRRRARIKRGHGDAGHYSKRPIKNWARNSKVVSAKDANLECLECHKKTVVKGGFKAKRFELIK